MDLQKAAKKPFSLFTLGFVSVVFSFMPALFLFGVNFKRLNQPQKSKLPIILSFAIALIFIALVASEFYFEIVILPDKSFEFIKLIDILIIFLFKKLQGEDLKKYKSEGQNKYANPFLAILIGLIWFAVFMAAILASSGVSWKDYFKFSSVENSPEYKAYESAFENAENLSAEETLKLITPFYEKYRNDELFGPEATWNYAKFSLITGNFVEGKKNLLEGYEKFKDSDAFRDSPEFRERYEFIVQSVDVYEDIELYWAYSDFSEKLFEIDKAQATEALPVFEEFHQRYKEVEVLDGQTYFDLSYAYALVGNDEKAKELILEGAEKFPKNLDLQKAKDLI